MGISNVTEVIENTVTLKKRRPALIVTSTSWTDDEDFDLLLDAIRIIERNQLYDFPKCILFITGKGPNRSKYEKIVSEMKLESFEIRIEWLESDDYPKILGSFDLGLCLHFSSSGMDLPMKVVDMFGSGLPVLACKFKW